jgi:hypothetical protein
VLQAAQEDQDYRDDPKYFSLMVLWLAYCYLDDLEYPEGPILLLL